MAEPMIDERLQAVEQKQASAVQEVQDTYGGMVQNADQYYDKQIQATQDWADKQTQLQNQQTELTIEQIEQQKEQAQKDYTKEQSGAYVDYQKQTAQHGVQAEQQAAAGMAGTGYSESSKVSMYNTYQNRVAAARESYNQVVMNYNNSIKEARLQNSSVLAEIAFNALQKGLELSLQGFQYKNQLVTEGLGMKLDVENMYHSQYMDVLGQINTENALAEEVRQFDLSHQLDVEALAQEQANWQKEFDQAQKNWQTEFDYGKEQDALAQSNWQAEYDLTAAQIKQSQKLEAAQVMAAAGDFSGYKDALGLTSAQVKKLEAKYQEEVTSEAEAAAYEKKLDRAAVLAASGDFSGYQDLYGLTDDQVKKLEEEYEAQNTPVIVKDETGGTEPGGETVDAPTGLTQEEANTRLNGIYGDLESYDFDNGSLAKLGYGDVSDEEFMELYMNGALDYTVVGGKMVFKKGKYYKDPRATKGGSAPAVGKNNPTVRQ